MFKRAIVRPPAANFAAGLTLTRLEADPRYPDSTFVEDTAVLAEGCAILTHPGAPSRQGEVASIRETLTQFYSKFYTITPPGTLEGGDICEAGQHFLIGVSERTNEAGARQLAGFLAQEGYTSALVDIRGTKGILHLKSGLTYLGDNRLLLIDALAGHGAFRDYEVVRVESAELYAANGVRGIAGRCARPRLPDVGARNVRIPEDGRRIELLVAPVLTCGWSWRLTL